MNNDLDKLLCKIDGLITVYRMTNKDNNDLIDIQHAIQYLWNKNKNGEV